MKLYLSGAISGRPDYRERFAAAAEYLAHLGDIEVLNPAAFPEAPERDWAAWMLYDLAILRGAAALVVLPGWQESRGARIEVEFARGLGIPVLDLADVRVWAAGNARSA